MLSIEPFDGHLGATVTGVDTSKPLSDGDFGQILAAIGRYGLVRFPDQKLTAEQQKAFSVRFGTVPPIRGRLAKFVAPGVPEVNLLTNEKSKDGEPLGATDAGVIWHTDMVHDLTPGFANVLYCLKIPRRDGKVLGATEFVNLKASYDSLPDDVKARLDGVYGIYTGEDYMKVERKPVSAGASHKSDTREPVTHPVVLVHPISGDKVLYCDLGHVDKIEGGGLSEAEAAELLTVILENHLKPENRYMHRWTEGDLAIWDNLRTLHHAIFDYGKDEIRSMWRCQVRGEKVFDPAFIKSALAGAQANA